MNINYHKWLELKVINNYFQEGVSSVFDIIPLNDTTRLLKNYDILINKNQNVFSFYVGTKNQSELDFEQDFKGLTDLYFQVVIDDPFFFNYTEIPSSTRQHIYYFEDGNDQDNLISLQKNQFVSKEDLIVFKPKAFTIPLPAGDVAIEIRKSNGDSVYEVLLNGDIVRNHEVNLKYLDVGVYELWINNQLQETFFCCEDLAGNSFGVLHLDMKNIITKGSTALLYQLSFDSRAVYWQYQVVVRDTKKIEVVDMSVAGIHKEGYEGPEKQQIVGGQVAHVFTTTAPIQLQNRLETHPKLQMTYSNSFSGIQKQLEIKLPNPGIESLKKYNHGKGDNSFLLSTIVYV